MSSTSPNGTVRRAGRLVVAALVVAMAVPATAHATHPRLLGWPELLPGLPTGGDPSSSDVCPTGDEACVQAVIATMAEQVDAYAAACAHHAVFALGYLRTTEAYYEAWQEPGFFADPAWMNHYDAVFAAYYFDARAAWHAGDTRDVPPAWETAFRAADQRRVSGLGNFLLGMNAHINRDLPMVLAEIGLRAPDGSSRKPDHDRVNVFLDRVSDDVVAEVAARFDPTFDDLDLPGELDGLLVHQVIQAWRETAWRNAELLTSTPRLLRPLVRSAIETGAGLLAEVIVAATSYPPGQSSAARDAWCAEHGTDGSAPAPPAGPATFAAAPDGLVDLDDPAPLASLWSLRQHGLTVDATLEAGVTISR